uniref:Uncharacterized protein n=1 Tax=viral metagenome TaxID=1070528 RepID=A0A6C0H6C3_9ZZZZ
MSSRRKTSASKRSSNGTIDRVWKDVGEKVDSKNIPKSEKVKERIKYRKRLNIAKKELCIERYNDMIKSYNRMTSAFGNLYTLYVNNKHDVNKNNFYKEAYKINSELFETYKEYFNKFDKYYNEICDDDYELNEEAKDIVGQYRN